MEIEDFFDDLFVLMERQTNDLGLWGHPQTAEEEYLQIALREIHEAIEKAQYALEEE